MYSYRGRTGPSRSTPANVQCQKCLKRDKSFAPSPYPFLCHKLTFLERHYSYECKAAPQERPYAARPSRSQQLRNPKLVPKLTEATLDEAERKKGVADAELAKKEAERARKRELEGGDNGLRGRRRRRGRQTGQAEVVAGGLVPEHLQEAAGLAEADLWTLMAMRDDHKLHLLARLIRETRRVLDTIDPHLLGVGAGAGAFPLRTRHLDNFNRGCSHQTSLAILEPQSGDAETRDHQTGQRGENRDGSVMTAVSTGLATTRLSAEMRDPRGLNPLASEV